MGDLRWSLALFLSPMFESGNDRAAEPRIPARSGSPVIQCLSLRERIRSLATSRDLIGCRLRVIS